MWRKRFILGLAVLVALGLSVGAAQATNATGTLHVKTVFSVTQSTTSCPSGIPAPDTCFQLTGHAGVRGLGQVTESYLVATADDTLSCIPLRTGPVSLAVAGRGTINASLGLSADCNGMPTSFSVTGGSGAYASASGAGSFTAGVTPDGDDLAIDTDDMHDWIQDTWTGTLTVPGATFDLTPPVISGAASKLVHIGKTARSARLEYHVSATDAVDGKVPVRCTPPSGSGLRIGHRSMVRKTVHCSATDSSANTAHASFTVTFERGH